MRVVLCFAVLSVFACGGGSISTGLPRDQQLNTLSAADKKTACLNTQNSQVISDAEITGLCASQLLPQGAMKCTSGLADCVAQTKAAVTQAMASNNCDQSATIDATTNCSATVGELEDCLNAGAAYMSDRYGSVTCSTTNPPSGTIDPYHQPGCATLNQKCPNLFR